MSPVYTFGGRKEEEEVSCSGDRHLAWVEKANLS
jgi:hypothetical protein